MDVVPRKPLRGVPQRDDLSAAASFQAWEKQASEAWASLIRSPDFLQAMNQQLESSLLLKQQLDRALEAALKAALLPTSTEQERILHLIRELEGQIQQLEQRVDQLSAALTAQG
jgi:hypothetical protein